ncbi:MAG: hypothetical protein JWN71_1013 [Xanthobacteraceae bacterium]|nr:hypothetical protein [Xanthobacteraceae bacterium]
MQHDRVGLGWRPELAAGIFDSLDRIDILEVIADNYVDADRAQRQGLAMIARDVAIHLHSIDLGLAGSDEVATVRLERIARLVDDIKPEAWSDHLAFTRSGDIEIGHLAAPPRTPASVEATVRNVRKAARIVGSVPFMENIATLIDPPGSTLSEAAWIAGIMSASGCGLLLDLHNLYANATNFGFDPLAFLDEIPLDRVDGIHIAGGKWISSPDGEKAYLLDDHLHPVDEAVFGLLSEVASRTAQALTVILERDGAYPPMPELLAELDRAREAMRAGRRRRAAQEAAHIQTADAG